MSQIDVSSVLNQMRQLSLQAAAVPEGPIALGTPVGASTGGQSGDFGDLLKQSIAAISATQSEAGKQAAAFERGDPGADLARAMVATQKAELSVRALTEARNRLTEAYTNIMNMPV